MLADAPQVTDIVLVGGGHTHALLLGMWAMRPLPGVRLTLINPGPTAPYSGMLPGHVAGHYPREALDIDLVRLARCAGARLALAPATGIDPDARLIHVADRPPIAYDIASIDVGIHARMPEIAGFAEHAVAVKPLDAYADAWAAFRARAASGEVPAAVAVIGGGVAGVELALAMAHALRSDGVTDPSVTIIEAESDLVGATPATRRHLARAMPGLGVTAVTGARPRQITARAVILDDGREVPARFTVAAAGPRAHDWLAASDLPLTSDGFVRVGADLRVIGRDDLFAVGDCAHFEPAPRPKAGVYAVRAAPVLLHNLRAAVTGGPTRPFRPQKHYLKLVSLGGRNAIAEKWGLAVAGRPFWRWKDRIDRKFMAKFHDMKPMQAPPPPAHVARALAGDGADPARPFCAGCGAKVSPGVLAQALGELRGAHRPDVIRAAGDDAAVIEIGGQQQVLTTDHLRAFVADEALFARIATIHALGDIWAMGAAPQAALVSVTLPRMTGRLQRRRMAEMLSAIEAVLAPIGAEIVGGHSTMGAELTLGLTVTGLLDRPAIQLSGAEAGDALILTRPIGSGTILAAEMAGAADGRDVADMLAIMARPQGDAAALLADAHAMTDVTGFGLAGHLMGICRASGLAAEIEPDAVPHYRGAAELAAKEHRSTIWAANRAAAPVFGAEEAGAAGALLHDPQTAGGLLAAVPAGQAEDIVRALHAAGHGAAAIIGRMIEGPPAITLSG